MNRPALPSLVGAVMFAAATGAVAQQAGRLPLVGVLQAAPIAVDPTLSQFVEDLQELGYQNGKNIRLAIRSADAHPEQLAGLAAELVRIKPNVIVAINTPAAGATIGATKKIPIALFSGDPIGNGFVSNLAHPGGNVTGVSTLASGLAAKRLQLLKEIIPNGRRVAVLFNPDDPLTVPQRRETERAAPRVGVEVRFVPVRAPEQLNAGFQQLRDWGADGLLWLLGQERPFMPATIDLSAKYRLPTMVPRREQVTTGGLICYYPVYAELVRSLAAHVDKILKGAEPGDLPVEQPAKFELVINLKTAKALGLVVPQSVLARADQVIE